MKILLSIFFLYTLGCGLCSCAKMPNTPCGRPNCDTTVVVNPPPVAKLDSQILWQVPFFPDTSSCISMYPLVYKDYILYSRRATVKGEPYLFLNKMNGEKIVEVQNEQVTTSTKSSYQNGNLLAINFHHKTQVLDLEQQGIVRTWNSRDYGGEGQFRIGGYDHFILWGWYTDHSDQDRYTNYMVRGDMVTGRLDTLFSVTDTTCFDAGFERASPWVSPAGDTMLIFQNRQYRFGTTICAPNSSPYGRVDLLCYNMTKRRLEWRKINITPKSGDSSVHPILIKDGKAFFQGGQEGILYDCQTGQEIWKREFLGSGFYQTNAVMAEGKIILKSEGESMYALDFETGETAWINSTAGHSNTNMIYHKGKVYYETGQDGYGVLRALRISDGAVTWTYFPQNNKKYSNSGYGLSGIAIDHERDLLYTSDLRFMQCIKIPK